MFQSYKTNRCWLLALGLVLLLNSLPWPVNAQKQASRRWQQFRHYERTFRVPEKLKDPVWEYVLNLYKNPPARITTEALENFSSFQFFDTPAQDLKKHQAILFREIDFEKDGRSFHTELWQKTANGWQITRFRNNKKPDKGKAFTNHPLLKLLRTQDRADLDSLLLPFHLKGDQFRPVFESNQDQHHLQIRRNGTDWVILTLREVKSEDPEFSFIELAISPDRKTFTHAAPAQSQQLIAFTDNLANQLQKQFPRLQPEKRSLYEKLSRLREEKPPALVQHKIIFGIIVIGGLLLLFFLRKRD